MRQHWLFAYGSLMWNPGFEVAELAVARLEGWHRSFCLRSIQHRGTPELPGLVLGLDDAPGAVCAGLALRVAPDRWPEVLAEVRRRELVTDAYREAELPVSLADGRVVNALCYVMRRDHWQYAGALPPEEQARVIASARGGRGANAEYLFNTASHLSELGLADPEMDALARRVRALTAG